MKNIQTNTETKRDQEAQSNQNSILLNHLKDYLYTVHVH